jgi:hypothetical protein
LLAGLVVALSITPVCAAPDELPADAEVAVIGNDHFTLGQLQPSLQTDLTESQRRYEQQLHQLALDHRRDLRAIVEAHTNTSIDDRVMQAEARARNVTVEELTKQVKHPQVTDAEVRAFYGQNKGEIKQPFEAVAVPITHYLTEQAAASAKRSLPTVCAPNTQPARRSSRCARKLRPTARVAEPKTLPLRSSNLRTFSVPFAARWHRC